MRAILIATTIIAVSATASLAQTPIPPFKGRSLASFFASIGVDTHLAYSDGYGMYVDYTTLNSGLSYLGLKHLRDSLPDPNGSNSTYIFNANAEKLSVAGYQFDLILGAYTHPVSYEQGALDTLFAGVGGYARGPAMKAGSLTVVEGLNEITNQNPAPSIATATAWQRSLLCLTRQASFCTTDSADANLKASKVAEFTSNGPVAASARPTTGFPADYMNGHSYAAPSNAHGVALSVLIGNAFSQVYGVAANEYLSDTTKRIANPPPTLTESGAYAEPLSSTRNDLTYLNSYDAHTVAIKDLDTIFEGFSIGAYTYLYQLFNNYTGDSDNMYGLFTYGGTDSNGNPIATPTTAATAIHNLTAIMNSPGVVMSPTANNCLEHTFSGAGGDFHSMMFQADDSGDYGVILWRDDPSDWNNYTHAEVAVAPTALTMNLAYPASGYIVDPMISTLAQRSFGATKTLAVSLADDPLVVVVHTSNTNDTSCAN